MDDEQQQQPERSVSPERQGDTEMASQDDTPESEIRSSKRVATTLSAWATGPKKARVVKKKRAQAKQQVSVDLDEVLPNIIKRLTLVESQVVVIQKEASKETSYQRRRNVICFQLPISANNDDPETLRDQVCNFLDVNVAKEDGWCTHRVKCAFKISPKFGNPPVIITFRKPESVGALLSKCRNLKQFNQDRKSHGERPVSIKRHYDAYTNRTIQQLLQLSRALKSSVKYHNLNIQMRESIPPRIIINGTAYEHDKVPQKFSSMIQDWGQL